MVRCTERKRELKERKHDENFKHVHARKAQLWLRQSAWGAPGNLHVGVQSMLKVKKKKRESKTNTK